MMTVHEVSVLTGVSVRTLHHYDAIGLLKPAEVTPAGYRLYDDACLARLGRILIMKELMFPLKDIKRFLDSRDCGQDAMLSDHIRLLEIQRDRLNDIIEAARNMQQTGADKMDLSSFNKTGIDAYKAEAKARWGGTEAYAQYEKREKSAGNKAMQQAGDALMDIIADIAALRPLEPSSPEAAAKVRALQAHITANFYECTDEILAGLGQMYVADERFKNNIDKHAGEGAAEYVSAAIAACVSK